MEKGIRIAKVLVMEYLLTTLALLLLAALLLKFGLSNAGIRIGIILIYTGINFLGGLLIGKIMKQKKFLWGFLVGLSYFFVVSVISWIFNRGFYTDFNQAMTVFALCTAGGMAGGMLS